MGNSSCLRAFVSVDAIVTYVTAGMALGVSNVLVNDMRWLGAYRITCPARTWSENPLLRSSHTLK
jgi:hypothetical protein